MTVAGLAEGGSGQGREGIHCGVGGGGAAVAGLVEGDICGYGRVGEGWRPRPRPGGRRGTSFEEGGVNGEGRLWRGRGGVTGGGDMWEADWAARGGGCGLGLGPHYTGSATSGERTTRGTCGGRWGADYGRGVSGRGRQSRGGNGVGEGSL